MSTRMLIYTAVALIVVQALCSNRVFANSLQATPPLIDWDTELTQFRVDTDAFVGQRFQLRCPERTVRDTDTALSGTGQYPSESAICVAAVHAGAITRDGGDVVLQLEPGARHYSGSERHDIVSADFPETQRSFRFVERGQPDPTNPIQSAWAPRVKWDTKFTRTGLALRDLVGQQFLFVCPAAAGNLKPIRITGTDSYAFDSYLCQAAVHAGQITHAGGFVVVQINESDHPLRGSIRNGIESRGGSAGNRTLTFPKTKQPAISKARLKTSLKTRPKFSSKYPVGLELPLTVATLKRLYGPSRPHPPHLGCAPIQCCSTHCRP